MVQKEHVRRRAFKFIQENFGNDAHTKMTNICGKTGCYDVPIELFQKRTSRKNRVLISWKTVRDNKFTLSQLETFTGGVVVELANDDYFNEENKKYPLFNELTRRIGGDAIVSAIITFRSESGLSSSSVEREWFNVFLKGTKVFYKGVEVIVNKSNYKDYALKQIVSGGTGNEKWSGFLFVSVKGGQQDSYFTHPTPVTLFNPACEYAREDICTDIDLVLSYFALLSVRENELSQHARNEYRYIVEDIRRALSGSNYNSDAYRGDLLSYCDKHICVLMQPGKLFDPIQAGEITIGDFSIKEKEDPRNLDLTHDEAVNKNKYYWDEEKQCILSPARPTNIFWSKHTSNMIQQDYSLIEFFEFEKRMMERREELFKQQNINLNKKG